MKPRELGDVRVDELVEELGRSIGKRTNVLVKGSRFMRMERVVEELRAGASGPK